MKLRLPALPRLSWRPRLPRWPQARPRPVPGAVARQHPAGPLTVEAAYLWYCMFAIWGGIAFAQLKIFYYLIPALGVIVALAVRRFSLPEVTWPYLVLMAVGVATAPLANLEGWQDLYLMLIGIMPFVLGLRHPVSWWRVFAFALIGTAITLAIGRGADLGNNVRIDFVNSESSFESPFCFVFGVLAVWGAVTRRWKETLLAVVMTVLTLKRIALIGVLLTLLLVMMPRRLTDLLLRPLPMILFNAATVWVAMMYTRGEFDALIHQVLGQSANQAGMGRQAFYGYVVQALHDNPLRYAFIGGGAGSAYDVMKGGYDWLAKTNLHADVMKILLEYGAVAFAAFFWMVYRIRSLSTRLFWFYANVTLLTDNTLIYPFFIFAFCLAAQCAQREIEALRRGEPIDERLDLRLRTPRAWWRPVRRAG